MLSYSNSKISGDNITTYHDPKKYHISETIPKYIVLCYQTLKNNEKSKTPKICLYNKTKVIKHSIMYHTKFEKYINKLIYKLNIPQIY